MVNSCTSSDMIPYEAHHNNNNQSSPIPPQPSIISPLEPYRNQMMITPGSDSSVDLIYDFYNNCIRQQVSAKCQFF